MNPWAIAMGGMILFIGLHAIIDWYRKFGEVQGGSLIFAGTGLMAVVLAFFLPDPPVYTADPIEIIKEGGHR